MPPQWRRPLQQDTLAEDEWRKDTLRGRLSSTASARRRSRSRGESSTDASPQEAPFAARPARTWFRPQAFYLTVLNYLKRFFALFQPRPDMIGDPRCVSDRALPKHAPLRLYASAQEALQSGVLQCAPAKPSGRTLVLDSGAQVATWRFALFPNPAQALAAVPGIDFCTFGVAETVPSQWQLTGHATQDPPIYTNFAYPIPGRLNNLSSRVSPSDNPTGVYVAEFSLPDQWAAARQSGADGHDVVLILHGVCSSAMVFVNNQYIGYCEDSMTESEFDVSASLTSLVNRVTLVVPRYCSGSYLEDQDMWRLSGVHRSVELQLRPRACLLWDYELNCSFASGTLRATFDLFVPEGDAAGGGQYFVRTSLLHPETLQVVETALARVHPLNLNPEPAADPRAPWVLELDALPGRVRAAASACLYVGQALSDLGLRLAPWTADAPALYPVLIEVVAGPESALPVQVEVCRAGFRDVQIADGQLMVNRVPLTIRGVNRHEFDPHHGKVLSEASMLADVLQMKRHNVNAVRSCHYPQIHRWYELCDHYGLFVCDEANIETHGFTLGLAISLLQFDPAFLDAFASRVWAMVLRARNHPSIICWSLGNESGFGPNMEVCARLVRHLDPGRPVQYEGGVKSGDATLILGDGQDPISDFVCPMYHTPLQLLGYALAPAETRPVVLCEYGHMMGLSGGGLHLYWALFNSRKPEHASLQGGYLWDWVDQGLVLARRPEAVPREPALRPQSSWLLPQAQFARAWFGPDEPDDAFWLDARYGYGGDFGPRSGLADAQFCCNGLVFPDRTAKPCLLEAKFLMAPVQFGLDDVSPPNRVRVAVCCVGHERQAAAWPLEFGWTLTSEREAGREIGSGTFSEARPEIELPLPAEEGRRAAEPSRVFLRVSCVLGAGMSWAPKGHELAYQSWELMQAAATGWFQRVVPSPLALLPSASSASTAPSADMCLVRQVGEDVAVASGPCFEAQVSLKDGTLTSLRGTADGRERLAAPLSLCFYRAPCDNDLGGADAHVPRWAAGLLPRSARSLAGEWRSVGLDREDLRVEACARRVLPGEARVVVECTASSAFGALFRVRVSYTFSSATVCCRVAVRPLPVLLRAGLKTLPRVGLRAEVPASCDQALYCARGPMESYPDRKAGAMMGVFAAAVDDMHVPYIFPSENGGRADARWFALRDGAGVGLKAELFCDDAVAAPDECLLGLGVELASAQIKHARPAGTTGAQISFSRFSVHELARAKHQCELSRFSALKQRTVKLHMDTAFCGVGGDVSWLPSVHPQYCVDPLAKFWTQRVDLSVLTASERDVRPVFRASFGAAGPVADAGGTELQEERAFCGL